MNSTMYLNSAADIADPEALLETSLNLVTATATTTVFFVVLFAIIGVIANWKIYSKAGEAGWACLVPIYTNVVQFKIVGLSPWLLLLYIVPIVNFVAAAVFAIMVPFRLAKSFGKDIGWGFGLWLLPFVFYLILGFGKSKYAGPNGKMKF